MDKLPISEEMSEIWDRIRKTEEEGLKNILKHFDRIHDKLFSFNNILIAGYFAVSKLENKLAIEYILIPIANLVFLIYIEYRMLEKSRLESKITKVEQSDRDRLGDMISNTNLFSFLSILTTFIVAVFFLYHLLTS